MKLKPSGENNRRVQKSDGKNNSKLKGKEREGKQPDQQMLRVGNAWWKSEEQKADGIKRERMDGRMKEAKERGEKDGPQRSSSDGFCFCFPTG